MQYLKNPDFKQGLPGNMNTPEVWKIQSIDAEGRPIDTQHQITPSGLSLRVLPQDASTSVFQEITLEPGTYDISAVLQATLQPFPQAGISASFFVSQDGEQEMVGLNAPFSIIPESTMRSTIKVEGGACKVILGLSIWVKQGRFDGNIIIQYLLLRDSDPTDQAALVITPNATSGQVEQVDRILGAPPDSQSPKVNPSASLALLEAQTVEEVVGLTLTLTLDEAQAVLEALRQKRGK